LHCVPTDDLTVTRYLAQRAARLTFADIPAPGVERAKSYLTDAVGCILAGVVSEDARIIRSVVEADGGKPVAGVFGTSLRASPAAAALANGIAGHALDYDDSSPPMIGHPSVNLAATLFALGSTCNATGRDVLTAYVAGLEIAAKLGRALNPHHYAAGWHVTATLGTLASAVAGAKLLGLDEHGIRMALGVAASSAGGVRKNFGSMVKPLHMGLAARNGALAAQLAKAGIETDPDALDGAAGFIDVFKGAAPMPDIPLDQDAPLEIVASGVGIKRYPCCGCAHSALDAMLALREEHRFDAARIASIHCTMNDLVPGILVHHRPSTPAQAKFSMEYCLAVAALDGDCGLNQFTDERVSRADVQGLLRRVTTSVDPSIIYRNGVYPGTVTLRFRDNSELSRYADEAKGHPDLPLSLQDAKLKFMACAARAIPSEQAQQAFDALTSVDRAAQLSSVTDHLSTN
jgi:2-methylcitrate dehydratase PrpD